MSAVPHTFRHTWRQSIDCATKGEATALLATWKREKEESGWTCTGSIQAGTVIAMAPGCDWQEEIARARAGKPPKLAASASIRPIE